MAKVQFKVSAKTARLIGRENITGVDGAIIELVKNAYDADASCVFIKYAIKYPYLMNELVASDIDYDLSEKEMTIFTALYKLGVGVYIKRSKEEYIAENKKDDLLETIQDDWSYKYDSLEKSVQSILFKRNTIIIIDNGCGMDTNIIENSWMRIGTSDKEINYVSEKGRVKTGAKGIGRFALDKLATETSMYTKSKTVLLFTGKLIGNNLAMLNY